MFDGNDGGVAVLEAPLPASEAVLTTTTSQDGGQAPPVAAPPVAAPLDPSYLARGAEWQLGEEELRGIPPHVLDRMFAAADNQVLESLAMAQADRQPPPSGYAAPPPAIQPPAQTGFAPLAYQWDGEEDERSPVRGHLDATAKWVNEFAAAQRAQYEQDMRAVGQYLANLQSAQDYATVVDPYVQSLGPEWEDVFGKGPTALLPRSSREFQQRAALLKAGTEFSRLDARLNRESPLTDVLLRARTRAFPQKAAALAKAAQEKRIKEVSAGLPGATGRASAAGSNGALKPSDAEIIARMRGRA